MPRASTGWGRPPTERASRRRIHVAIARGPANRCPVLDDESMPASAGRRVVNRHERATRPLLPPIVRPVTLQDSKSNGNYTRASTSQTSASYRHTAISALQQRAVRHEIADVPGVFSATAICPSPIQAASSTRGASQTGFGASPSGDESPAAQSRTRELTMTEPTPRVNHRDRCRRCAPSAIRQTVSMAYVGQTSPISRSFAIDNEAVLHLPEDARQRDRRCPRSLRTVGLDEVRPVGEQSLRHSRRSEAGQRLDDESSHGPTRRHTVCTREPDHDPDRGRWLHHR